MKIYGLQKTTLLDYPEHVAATIFTGGCNFRCPFCQNAGLVLLGRNPESSSVAGQKSSNPSVAEKGAGTQPSETAVGENGLFLPEQISEEEVFAHLGKRRGILDGLCITGGEPTLQPDLEDFIRRVRELGYAVKLDTNGYCPEVLERLLEQGLLDYVAMDIKASKENYAKAAGREERSCESMENAASDDMELPKREAESKKEWGSTIFSLQKIEDSIHLLRASGIPYEFRTTAVKGLHAVEEFEEIGKWLAGSRAYFIQNYEEQGEILGKICRRESKPESCAVKAAKGEERECMDALADSFSGFSTEELQQMAQLAGKYIPRVELRGTM